MKKQMILLVSAGLLVSVTGILRGAKKPPLVKEARGDMGYSYNVIHSTITYNPTSEKKPIITRGVKGVPFGGTSTQNTTNVDVELKVPGKEISFANVSKLTGAITKIVGACDPEAGAIAAACSVIIDVGAQVAGEQLTKFYGIDPLTMDIIEIMPAQYYNIDLSANSIKLTDQFKVDLKKYNDLITQYGPVKEDYNHIAKEYNDKYSQWLYDDPLKTDQAMKDELNNMYKNSVAPALQRKIDIEQQFKKYPLQRILLMATNTPASSGCSAGGAGSGPYHLFLYVFVGAKQVNQYEIDYCVPSTAKTQNFIVSLQPPDNDLDSKSHTFGTFWPGGVKLMATADNSISFPRQITISETNYKSAETPLYSWWDQLIVGPGDTLDSYLFPFNIKAMRDEYEAMAKKAEPEKKSKMLEALDVLDKAIKLFTGNKSEATSPSSEQSTSGPLKDEADALLAEFEVSK